METNRKNIYIKYVERYEKDDTSSVLLPVFDTLKTTTSHTKRYHNCLYLLADLKGCARNLMDYFTEVMDNNNHISTNKGVIEDFIFKMNRVGVEYGVDSVNKAIKKLKDKNFIILIAKGFYMVNPEYFIKNDSNREQLLRVMLNFKTTSSEIEIKVERTENENN